MRRTPRKAKKLTAQKIKGGLTRSCQERLASLEDQVRRLESRLVYVELNLGIQVYPEKVQKKPGPTPQISEEDLLDNRDRFIGWLEARWSDLRPKLLGAANTKQVSEALLSVAAPEESHDYYVKRILDGAGALWQFLHSRRFHRKPSKRAVVDALREEYDDPKRMKAAAQLPTRQIANAMAGVPQIGWRTSLDRCSKTPARIVVGRKTEDYYRALYGIPIPKRVANRANPSGSVPELG